MAWFCCQAPVSERMRLAEKAFIVVRKSDDELMPDKTLRS